ncbi:pyridoxamine 5'-phosphate oxidase family protein [Rhodocytophaga aerolata]|uniref:Pyridoxamine 5'-phosphate oxidase family protein n=1 Tax=Rhodocytophaga aerolata TaxID=455078 RepID=A0ABT8R3B4_9BACT|nr:pyridoxamine 5'-phosphate oxidase family protein [Rhodocytophaga aerolata]MDO1446583.1 pyridoxamine 5'-phosphate oxidase family protein [Rhodocytophaga aerolata]
MLGVLNQEQIDFVLRSQMIGHIGCCDAGRVYVLPVTYVYDGEYIYGHTKEGLKIEMMRNNPQVCFQVDAIQNLANWQSVVIQGTFEELSGEASHQAERLLLNRILPFQVSETIPSGGIDIHQLASISRPVLVTYRISIEEKSGRYEKR